jgi:hypothetical protein
MLNTYFLKLQDILDTFFDIFGRYYIAGLIALSIFYLLLFLGLLKSEKYFKYVNYANVFIQLYTCLYLLIRFHPFRNHEIKKHDSYVILHSALFLLINLVFVEGIKHFVDISIDETKEYTLQNLLQRHNENILKTHPTIT